LWVVCNGPARFWAVVEDGSGGWKVDTKGGQRAEYDVGGDTEGITQADPNEDVVYIVDEPAFIRAYDVSTGRSPVLQTSWNILSYLPFSFGGGLGPEGLTFVPDAALSAAGFVDGNGQLRTSQNGMGGLMFVVHQDGGNLYVFDLDRTNGSYDFVGQYITSHGESSGLEFDRSSGKLYIWHNTNGNIIEVNDLTSVPTSGVLRAMTTRALIQAPKGGNLEGIACTPESSGEGWWWFADDSNQNGQALAWYQDFPGVPLVAAAGPNTPGDAAVSTTAQDVPMLQLRLSAGQNVTVSRLSIRAQGTGDDATEVQSVQLWLDADGSGTITSVDTALGSPAAFSQDDGSVDFVGLNQALAPGTFRDYVVTYTLNSATGVTFQAVFEPSLGLLATSPNGTLLLSGSAIVGGAQRTATFGTPGFGGGSATTAAGSTTPTATASTGSKKSGGSGCSLGVASSSLPTGGSLLGLLLLALLARARRS
jgi:hypothetical protein